MDENKWEYNYSSSDNTAGGTGYPNVAAIRKLINERNPACELEVDGGVAPDTCQTCIDAGANVLVAGSAVYKAEDIPARIKELRGK